LLAPALALPEAVRVICVEGKPPGLLAKLAVHEVDVVLTDAPVAPHISEELWTHLGKPYSIHTQNWPVLDEAAAAEEEITLVLQINGKVRDRIQVPVSITPDQAQAFALSSPAVQKHLAGQTPRKVILVPGKLVNIVI